MPRALRVPGPLDATAVRAEIERRAAGAPAVSSEHDQNDQNDQH